MKLFTNKAKSLLLAGTLMGAMTSLTAQADMKLIGSGASFPAPIYSKWFKDFSKEHDGVRVDYQSKGSGGGISDFINETVDFAASDAAMKDEEIAKVNKGTILLPMTAGEVVLTFNLDGVTSLNLPRDVYPEIFMGKITQWNDPKIQAANPNVTLPEKRITVVVRADSSGTSYVFTNHLSAISDAFKETVGTAKSPNWPNAGTFVKAPKNDGIAATVKQTPGAIGYVEYGFAKLTKLPTAKLENQKGNFIEAGSESGAQALASTPFPTTNLPNSDVPDLRGWVTDPSSEEAYPIASFTWLLVYKDMDDEKAKVMRDLIEYMVTTGQKSADSLGYIPLPENVIEKVRNAAKMIQ
ncbi:Phosphate ABC transporter, periplasmic phosphate-binding protein PstS [Methylophaga frappieri]|uniref:Phosphate-binding protein PstS n=1 Tax=Methylophaga frappieri (strain ATCC BAA-2434 / DSM 25690 / JAM7) TaxID=754477 RepID=I1YKD7_METFJ|nr:phosphate ABC transporter substrate-binding protein PstS [Methylophaga frappieri]AFJ03380.1 Phosphate ABC transporter, periplasmic phosphate-binding protein PstS [Methylophaga frappieri]